MRAVNWCRLRKMEGTGELKEQHRKQNGDCLGGGGEQEMKGTEGDRSMNASRYCLHGMP